MLYAALNKHTEAIHIRGAADVGPKKSSGGGVQQKEYWDRKEESGEEEKTPSAADSK